jgi:capsular polysaccharide biosynthesis protein
MKTSKVTLARKPPKREKKHRHYQKFPDSIALPVRDYDALRKLTRWVENTPDDIELDESTWDAITSRMSEAVEDYLPNDAYVVNVQIESEKTKQAHTQAGDLVALVENDESIDACLSEFHVVITRKRSRSGIALRGR